MAEHEVNPVPTFLTFGFRPFFLFAGIYAVLVMIAWILAVSPNQAIAQIPLALTDWPPQSWHAHEMLFGYALAVISGFFLTAVPNWTGSRPVQGNLLLSLAVVWVAARIANWTSAYVPALWVALLDAGYIIFLILVAIKGLSEGGSKRNFIFIPILLFFLTANLLVHGDRLGYTDETLRLGHILALDTVVLLITIIGGRVIPAFTTNVLHKNGETTLPTSHHVIESTSIILVFGMLLADLAQLSPFITGIIALGAAVVNAVRLAGWCGHKTLGQPILWVIHLGYLWLVIGLALRGWALIGGPMAHSDAIHALTIGAIGTMTLGIMTRAALGHTGRPLTVSRATGWAYGLITAAAVVRLVGPTLVPNAWTGVMHLSAGLWCLAFIIFVWVYWPILTRPRWG
ncbi:MAG: NnrS family protein [Proteobacteria bacterium]|nr:NnrS family protein [Pseudomonadota bacterium]